MYDAPRVVAGNAIATSEYAFEIGTALGVAGLLIGAEDDNFLNRMLRSRMAVYLGTSGELEHGIVSYMPKFFWALATANACDIISMWAGCSPAAAPVPESFLSPITFD